MITSLAAWAAAIGVVVGTILAGFINWLLEKQKYSNQLKLLVRENVGKEAVKQMLQDMLNHRNHIDRSFVALKGPIGGYSDDEIRKLLHEIEAKKVNRKDGSEWWYLLERQQERIARRTAEE